MAITQPQAPIHSLSRRTFYIGHFYSGLFAIGATEYLSNHHIGVLVDEVHSIQRLIDFSHSIFLPHYLCGFGKDKFSLI